MRPDYWTVFNAGEGQGGRAGCAGRGLMSSLLLARIQAPGDTLLFGA